VEGIEACPGVTGRGAADGTDRATIGEAWQDDPVTGPETDEPRDATQPSDDVGRIGDGPDGDPPDVALLAELADRESAYGLLRRGEALLRRRHHAQAAVILERAAHLEPGKASIVEALARAYYNSGQHARAVGAFQELLDLDPSAAYGHYGLGQALKQVGRHAEARTHLRLAVALAPDSALYRAALARLR
jgi:tetratricopeptide (TPR) repeat protein